MGNIFSRKRQFIATASQWSTKNPVLASGEIGIEAEYTSGKITKVALKSGDGVSTWNTLPYMQDPNVSLVGRSNDYRDLDFKPVIPDFSGNHSDLNLDDGTNPHDTDKEDVGLGNVDNTSDENKPVSILQQQALNLKANISDLAPVAFSGDYEDLENKPDGLTPITQHSALNLDDGTNPHDTDKEDVGLGLVDNTPDSDKPVSIPQQQALDLKLDITSVVNDFTNDPNDPELAAGADTVYQILQDIEALEISDFENIILISDSTYLISEVDSKAYLIFLNACTVTLPDSLTDGFNFWAENKALGTIEFLAEGTLESKFGGNVTDQFEHLRFVKISSSTWSGALLTGSGGAGGVDAEEVRDIVGSLFIPGQNTNPVYDDVNDTLKIDVDLSNYETFTQLNARDTANRDRSNHTGQDEISDINGLQAELDAKLLKSVNLKVIPDTTTTYTILESDLSKILLFTADCTVILPDGIGNSLGTDEKFQFTVYLKSDTASITFNAETTLNSAGGNILTGQYTLAYFAKESATEWLGVLPTTGGVSSVGFSDITGTPDENINLQTALDAKLPKGAVIKVIPNGTTTYTVLDSDLAKILVFSSDCTITLPNGVGASLPVDEKFQFTTYLKSDTATLTFVAEGTLNGDTTQTGNNTFGYLLKDLPTTWVSVLPSDGAGGQTAAFKESFTYSGNNLFTLSQTPGFVFLVTRRTKPYEPTDYSFTGTTLTVTDPDLSTGDIVTVYYFTNVGDLVIGGGGSGDMLKATYDPQNIEGDSFARANHTGTQAISTVAGLQTELNNTVKLTGNQSIDGNKIFLQPVGYRPSTDSIADLYRVGLAGNGTGGLITIKNSTVDQTQQSDLGKLYVKDNDLIYLGGDGQSVNLSNVPIAGTVNFNQGFIERENHVSINSTATTGAENLVLSIPLPENNSISLNLKNFLITATDGTTKGGNGYAQFNRRAGENIRKIGTDVVNTNDENDSVISVRGNTTSNAVEVIFTNDTVTGKVFKIRLSYNYILDTL